MLGQHLTLSLRSASRRRHIRPIRNCNWQFQSHLSVSRTNANYMPIYVFLVFCNTFVTNKCLCKILVSEPALMSTVSAICCTLTWRFCVTIFSIAWEFSSQTASDGRPGCGQGLVCHDETQPTHMTAHFHKKTTIIRFCIWCGRTILQRKKIWSLRYTHMCTHRTSYHYGESEWSVVLRRFNSKGH